MAVFAFSDRIAGLLPQSTWFVIVFVLATLTLLLWFGRQDDPAIKWLFDRLRRRPRK